MSKAKHNDDILVEKLRDTFNTVSMQLGMSEREACEAADEFGSQIQDRLRELEDEDDEEDDAEELDEDES